MSKKNNIENLFQESFESFAPTPPPVVKQRINKTLNFSSNKGIILFSILMLIGVSTFAYFNFTVVNTITSKNFEASNPTFNQTKSKNISSKESLNGNTLNAVQNQNTNSILNNPATNEGKHTSSKLTFINEKVQKSNQNYSNTDLRNIQNPRNTPSNTKDKIAVGQSNFNNNTTNLISLETTKPVKNTVSNLFSLSNNPERSFPKNNLSITNERLSFWRNFHRTPNTLALKRENTKTKVPNLPKPLKLKFIQHAEFIVSPSTFHLKDYNTDDNKLQTSTGIETKLTISQRFTNKAPYGFSTGLRLNTMNYAYATTQKEVSYEYEMQEQLVYDSMNMVTDTLYNEVIVDSTIFKTQNSNQKRFTQYTIPVQFNYSVKTGIGKYNLETEVYLGVNINFNKLEQAQTAKLFSSKMNMDFTAGYKMIYGRKLQVVVPINFRYSPKPALRFVDEKLVNKFNWNIGLGLRYNF